MCSKKSFLHGIQMTMTTGPYRIMCVKFYDIFKTLRKNLCPAVFTQDCHDQCETNFLFLIHKTILLNIVTTYVLKTFWFISTWQWQSDPRQLCVYCSKTFLSPVMPTSILLYIVKTYVCITIFTFLRLCVQC